MNSPLHTTASSPAPPQLTPQQQKALDVGNHLAVTANAGAGKTSVLVRRFLEILARTGAGVGEIVAITFTEKAAGELRRKIAAQVEERIRHASSVPLREHLEEVRDQLSSATIGTIHAFCAQLLRAYPVEAGVDPSFTVLEGIDQRILQHDALQEAFEEVMGEPEEHPERRALLGLVRMFGRSAVQEHLSTLLEKREQIERLLEGVFDERHDDAFILARWHEMLSNEARLILSRDDWRGAVQNMLRVADGPAAPEAARLLEEPFPAATPEESFSLCHRLLGSIFTQAGGFRKKFMGTGEPGPELAGDVAVLDAFREEILYLSRHFMHKPSLEANTRLLAATRLLLTVYRRCEAVYERKKSETGVLDFEDLQLKARALLRSPGIAGRLMQRYRFIMVDEFQDTNRLQYEILKLLVGNFSSGNLFIVGDPKQSIYGFRNAEVEVFEEARREIVAAARHRPVSGSAEASPATVEGAGAVVLSESFRPLSGLVAFTNTLFGGLMGRTGSSYDVHYDELVRGRSDRGSGLVEILLVPEEAAAEAASEGEEDPRATSPSGTPRSFCGTGRMCVRSSAPWPPLTFRTSSSAG